jgi:hypothetical protein
MCTGTIFIYFCVYAHNENVCKHRKVSDMGYRGRRGRYPGNGPFSDLPPWQRPGWVYGYGRGYGLGYGRMYAAGDPSKCARFPWLPRWWWTNPDYQGAVPTPAAGDIPAVPTPPDERTYLQSQMKYMEQELESVRKRLDELRPEETA